MIRDLPAWNRKLIENSLACLHGLFALAHKLQKNAEQSQCLETFLPGTELHRDMNHASNYHYASFKLHQIRECLETEAVVIRSSENP